MNEVEPGFSVLNAAVPLTNGGFAVVSTAHADLAQVGWHLQPTGYVARSANRRTLLMHRHVAQLAGLQINGMQVDHRNGDRTDNRLENLRVASNAQNARNQTRKQDGATSRFKGVSRARAPGRWQAHIRVNAKNVYLGTFGSEIQAQDAYAAAAIAHFGEFAAPRVERKL